MRAPRLAVAAGSVLGARAAAEVAADGGNAVDACLAAAIAAWVAEPFMASPGGSGFIAVRSAEDDVRVYDGNNAMPLNRPADDGEGPRRVYLEDYSNGMYTGIGGGSVAVPGVLAAIRRAWEQHGRIEWDALFAPAIRAARDGIEFPRTSAYYLAATWREIWSVYRVTRELLSVDGRPIREGETLVQAELADALELVARAGPDAFYGGELGAEIVFVARADGGVLTLEDLKRYEAAARVPVVSDAFGWRIESNPPPAAGGAVLAHMLTLLDGATLDEPLERLRAVVDAERSAIRYRNENYEDPSEIAAGFEQAVSRSRGVGARSQSTTHQSAASSDGVVCSLSESIGYAAGVVVRGVFLNNSLGEEELNPGGAFGLPPGSRCHSNMAPTIATGMGSVVALGSPGADRIVGAIAQTLVALAVDRLPLTHAVAAPRAHLSQKSDVDLLCFEPGLPGEELARDLGCRPRPYDDLHMFFGAVQAASLSDDGTVSAARDPRRSGGTALV